MLKEGTEVFFLINGYIMSGRVINVKGNDKDYNFSIEGYAGCAGPHSISYRQIHRTVFFTQEEAKKYKNNPHMYLSSYC